MAALGRRQGRTVSRAETLNNGCGEAEILLATNSPCQDNTAPVSTTANQGRTRRFFDKDRQDQRGEFQRDRDRILYCSAFRRLAEVTQVVSAAEGYSFHNRLTHTLKVAQIARRLSEKLTAEQKREARALHGPDPEVAEAAALAHDLGHPPFGHIAEEELQRITPPEGLEDGFEGNAQSFRIVTKLAIRTRKYDGLNLTAATLNAILKYPHFRAELGEYERKWGVYPEEREVFQWARETVHAIPRKRTVEAEIMDWSDDIAYSVFDVDDFYRAGMIPLDQVLADQPERERFLESAKKRLTRWKKKDVEAILQAFRDLVKNFSPASFGGRFQGRAEQRAVLREWTSLLVARYIEAIRLQIPGESSDGRSVNITPELKNEVEALKQLVWHYVIESERLVTQQHGQRTVVRELFELFVSHAKDGIYEIFPEPYRTTLVTGSDKDTFDKDRVRVVIDMISGLTETQAFRLHQRLSGRSSGSILDHH